MEQNNNNIESFDSSAETVVFNPIKEEKEKNIPPVDEIEEDIYYEDDSEDDEEDSSNSNGILIGLVIILVVLFIAALIWGTAVLSKLNKKEELPPAPQETEETVIEEEFEDEVPAEEEGEKITCKIFFKYETVEEEDDGYTVRTIFKDENGKYYTERLTVDSETKIKEDGDSLLYKSFINNVIKKLGNNEVEFDGVVDIKTKHIDSISYKSEILEKEEVGIVLEDEELSEE